MEENRKNIINMSLAEIMSERFGRYAKYIIQQRALPDARDGLKPVQRRILFSMSELGLWDTSGFKKSARVVGDVIGKYHPHGDSSIYEAMVRMSQGWKMSHPLIEMHGNNGSIDDDPAAAMRYTEVRLSKVAATLIESIKKGTVNFSPNFDDSEKEPTVFPALLPNMLVNGAKGIAAGYATEMPPHNLDEVIEAIIVKIKSPNARLETLMKYIKGPDFPTGGVIQGIEGIYQAFERGRGRISIRSRFSLNESKMSPSITITEIPYGVVKAKLVRQIDEIKYSKKIDGIKEVRDESDRHGISIVVDLNHGANPSLIANYLLSKTEMQIYYNYNNVAIKNQRPTLLSLSELLEAYLDHQRFVQKKAISFDLAKNKTRSEIIEGLIRVASISDQIIKVIRESKGSKKGVVENLIKLFNFSPLQAEAIAELRLYRLSAQDQSGYRIEQENLAQKIAVAQNLLTSPESFDKYLIKTLQDLKAKHTQKRRSEVVSEMTKVEVKMDQLIAARDIWVGISRDGYLKNISTRIYEANEITRYKLKETDSIVFLQKVNTNDKLLIFSKLGLYVFLPVHKLRESKWKEQGQHINDFATLAPNDQIVSVVSVKDFSLQANLAFVTSQGQVKRTRVSDFLVSRFGKSLVAMNLRKNDFLIDVKIGDNLKQIIIIASNGKAVKYPETVVPLYGPKSRGIKGISLTEGSEVTAFALVGKEMSVGLLSRRGSAKRIKINSIKDSGRNTQGKEIYRQIKGNPHITLDASEVKTDSTAFLQRADSEPVTFAFKEIEHSSTKDGFSSVSSTAIIDGKILVRQHIDQSFVNQTKVSKIDDDEQFKAAEKAIEAVAQISMDDLLKDS